MWILRVWRRLQTDTLIAHAKPPRRVFEIRRIVTWACGPPMDMKIRGPVIPSAAWAFGPLKEMKVATGDLVNDLTRDGCRGTACRTLPPGSGADRPRVRQAVPLRPLQSLHHFRESAARNLLLLPSPKSRFSGFWSPMPRSERDSEDSTGVLKSDLVATLLGMTG